MAEAADRKEFGGALHDGDDDGLQCVHAGFLTETPALGNHATHAFDLRTGGDWTSQATGGYPCGKTWRVEGEPMASVTWIDSSVEIAGTQMHLSRGGSGPTLLMLHHDIGTLERLPFYDALAQSFDVLVPHHP